MPKPVFLASDTGCDWRKESAAKQTGDATVIIKRQHRVFDTLLKTLVVQHRESKSMSDSDIRDKAKYYGYVPYWKHS